MKNLVRISIVFWIVLFIAVMGIQSIMAAEPKKKAPVDWQELALQYKAQLEITETKRLTAVEMTAACEDRLGTLIAQGRQSKTGPALKAWRDYMAKKKKIKDAAAVEAAKAKAVKPVEKEEAESVPEPEPGPEPAEE